MKKLVRLFLVLVVLLPMLTICAYADTGPKPTVTLNIKGIDASEYYVTLLSESESTGPHSWVGFGGYQDAPPSENADIWQKFVDYVDPDGFYFLQYFEQVRIYDGKNGPCGEFFWNYYPPSRFKVLIYIPETEMFVSSFEIMDTYAFNSYFEVSLNMYGEPHLDVVRSYGYGWEIFAFLIRLGLTLAFELWLAWVFGFKEKKQILIILGMNIMTQLALNIGLVINGYESNILYFVLIYGFWELMIFIAEAVIYACTLHRFDSDYAPKRYPVMYAFTANLLSFLMGYIISQWFPFVF